MQQTEKLVFKYDGEALKKHKIELSVIAESLCAVNSLLNEINLTLNGTAKNLDVRVDAFQAGSFEYLLDVIQNPDEYMEILSIIGIGGAMAVAGKDTLISTIKRLNGRSIKKLSFTQDGNCKVTLDDESFTVPPYLKSLLASKSIRKSIGKLIYTPLQNEGIDSFLILNSQREEVININSQQSSAFKAKRIPVEETCIEKPEEDVVITFVSIHSDKAYNWRIFYNGEVVLATIKDDEFITRVKNGLEPNIFSGAYSANLTIKEDLYSLDKSYIVDKVRNL